MIKDSCRICKHRWICKVAEHLDLARREFSGKYMAWQTLDKLMDELKVLNNKAIAIQKYQTKLMGCLIVVVTKI